MKIVIGKLDNWYASVNYWGHNEGGGSPIKDEDDLKKTIESIKKRFNKEYTFIETDERIKQQKLF